VEILSLLACLIIQKSIIVDNLYAFDPKFIDKALLWRILVPKMNDRVDNSMDSAVLKAGASMSEQVFGIISNAIISGEIEPGAGMTEPELARRFGISRAPLREALRRLEEQQLVERNPYRGMRVTELSPGKVGELYEIREELEALACRRAADRMTPGEIEALKVALNQERKAIRDLALGRRPGQPSVLGTLSLHALIARISDNRELTKILDSAIWRLLRADYWRRVRQHPEALRASHQEHIAIVRALVERDGDLTALIMRRHIRNTMRRRDEPQVVDTQ